MIPSRIVCQSFSGSLPGTAKRASSPMIRPETISERTAPSTRALYGNLGASQLAATAAPLGVFAR